MCEIRCRFDKFALASICIKIFFGILDDYINNLLLLWFEYCMLTAVKTRQQIKSQKLIKINGIVKATDALISSFNTKT